MADPTEPSREPVIVRVWDLPTKMFHWLLVALVVVSVYTGKVGGLAEMDWHMRSGVAILVLVLFRVLWGIVGSPRSRFADFLAGPSGALRHLGHVAARKPYRVFGHNAAGGWVVVLFLVLLAAQAVTGLFSNDDIFTSGPLAAKVSKATSDLLTGFHKRIAPALLILVALHLAAIAVYRWWLGENLVKPMITGRKETDAPALDADRPFAPLWKAGAALAAAGAAVYALLNWW